MRPASGVFSQGSSIRRSSASKTAESSKTARLYQNAAIPISRTRGKGARPISGLSFFQPCDARFALTKSLLKTGEAEVHEHSAAIIFSPSCAENPSQ